MGNQPNAQSRRIEREVEREMHERVLHDEERTGEALCEELRVKDPRDHVGAVNVRRPAGR